MKAKYILFFILISASLRIYAQSDKLFSADKELSNSLINQVYQDRNGIMWIATEDGLNRYDGAKFTIYKYDELNPNSPLHSYIRSFYEDSKGNFYISYLNGLQQYDFATGVFTEIPLYLEGGYKFNAHVITLLERKNGQFVIATSGQGLFELKTVDHQREARQIESPSKSINTLFEDKDENLWFSTNDKGVFVLDKQNNLKNYSTTQKLAISCICQDKEGNIYIGSMSSGLYIYDKTTDDFISIPYPDNPHLPIKTIYVNQKNEILIGTDGDGMKIYDIDKKKIVEENFNVMTFDFSKSKIHSITEDQAGNIWLGIFQKGVMLLPSRSGKFGYIGYKSLIRNMIGSNCIMSLCEDHEGRFWVGTDNDGLYEILPGKNKSRHFPHSRKNGSVPSTIMCIYEDSEKNLWLGSYLHGLAKINRETGQCEYVRNMLDKNQHPVQRVYALVEDKHKNLWIGTMGDGLFRMNIQTGQINHFQGFIANPWINCLLVSRNNRLYIASHDGLSYVDVSNPQISPETSPATLLPRQVIYTLYEDTKGILWMGTAQGLASFNPETEEIVRYTMHDGLPSNVVCAIEGGGEDNLWVSTNYGISHFNLEKRTFTNYYSSDGLQGNEFSKNAVCVNSKGQLLFGGLNGITYFNPEDITIPEKELKIRITDFYIHDQSVKKGMKSGSHEIIDTLVMDAKNFRLAHNDNSFTIEFSTWEFNNPERITYIYSMNDNNWIRLRPGVNRVSFNNLAPGNYRFRVKAQDYDIQSEVKEIEVFISQPWYFSVWAKCLYTLGVFLIIYLIISQIRQRYKARQRILEHLHTQEINEAKLQFFINVSHEIRTPMSLVMSPLKKLITTDKDNERQKMYYTMNRNIDRVLRLINQLMDVRKIDKGQMTLKFQEVDMVGLLQDIHSSFEEQAKAKHITFVFHHNTEHLNAWVDLRNFDKIIINVLSNAFKFTPEGGEIQVYLQELDGFFEIVIHDNGVGIKEEEIERIFERFYQAKDMSSKSYEGTGIGLHLARSIVELHHGNIKAENNKDDKGCRFVIHLPLGCDHLKPEEMDKEPAIPFKDKQVGILPAVEPETEVPKVKARSKRNILVVDDDKDIREYICRELSADYHMQECPNGKEAYNTILKKAPDLIISDVVMPEMDGITLCRKVKQNIHINHIPIILLTAKSKEEDNLEGLDIGADAYMVKPFHMELLKKTVQNIIRNREMLRNNFSGSQLQKDKVNKIIIKSPDDKLLERIMKVIDKNIANTNLNVEMIATEVGISRVHLHRKLKELTNQSTRDLIRNIRLQQAANLLSSKKLSISEVASATGFTNLTHFSTTFKEMYGVPPIVYMEENRSQRENEEESDT